MPKTAEEKLYDWDFEVFKERMGCRGLLSTEIQSIAIVRFEDEPYPVWHNRSCYSPPRRHSLTGTVSNIAQEPVLSDIEGIVSHYGLTCSPDGKIVLLQAPNERNPVGVMGVSEIYIRQDWDLKHPLNSEAFIKDWGDGFFLESIPGRVSDMAVLGKVLGAYIGSKHSTVPW